MKALGCLFFVLICGGLTVVCWPIGVGVLVLGVVAKIMMH